jgi:hypothetical protein
MSLWDDIAANTAGVAYRAWTGHVDPWTLNQIKADTAAGIGKASGDSADPSVVAYRQQQANAQIDAALTSIDAHPNQVTGIGLRIPGLGDVGSGQFLSNLKTVVLWTLAGGAVVSIAYFGFIYSRTIKRAFRRK